MRSPSARFAITRARDAVDFAEPNWIYHHTAVPNDPYYTSGQLWGMYGDTSPRNTNQYGSQAGEAWDNGHVSCKGVVVGVIVQWLGRQLRERLIAVGVDDPVLQTLLAVLIPYAAYLAAEALHVSGVLAVVIAGLWTGGQEVKGLSADGRRHSREVWRMLAYIFNGLVFVLLGLQLRHMLAAVEHYDGTWLAFLALALWVVDRKSVV